MSLNAYVEVVFNGETKLLKFDYNSVSDIEMKHGNGIGALFSNEQVGFALVRVFYWGGLKWKNPGLTLEVVGNMIGKKMQDEGETLDTLMEPIMQALEKAKLIGGTPNGGEAGEVNEKN